MKHNPPHATDVNQCTNDAHWSGDSFDASMTSAEALARGAAAGLKLMREKTPTIARVTNGWQMNTDTMGVYGNYYLKRAIVAMIGLGANQVEDAIYPLNFSDADGKPVMAEKQIHSALQQGGATARRRLLVPDVVRRRGLPGS